MSTDACPESKMDDGSHSTDIEDGGFCAWCGASDPARWLATGSAAALKHDTPRPGEPQCEADGVRNGPDGPGGTEHYWTCTAPGTVDVDGELLCEDHAGERGYGPKQEEYGFDPDDASVSRTEEG